MLVIAVGGYELNAIVHEKDFRVTKNNCARQRIGGGELRRCVSARLENDRVDARLQCRDVSRIGPAMLIRADQAGGGPAWCLVEGYSRGAAKGNRRAGKDIA